MPRPGAKTALAVVLMPLVVGWCVVCTLLFLEAPQTAAPFVAILNPLTGNTPEGRIAAYVGAVARSDAKAALDTWEVPAWDWPKDAKAKLNERRTIVTHDLISGSIRSDYTLLKVQWWRKCCEPGVIQDSRYAGGARAQVQFRDRNGASSVYVFDVFVRPDTPWVHWVGMDDPFPVWVIRDVYPINQEPIFWQFKSKS